MADASNPSPRLLHGFFDRVAGLYPDRVAVDVPPGPGSPERVRVTYAELLAQADSLAAELRGHTAPDRVVGVLLPRNSHWLYVAQLAALKAGGAFTCLDPVFPDAHVRAVLDDGDVSVLLTDRAGAARLGGAGIDVPVVIDVTDRARRPVRLNGESKSTDVTPGHLAYVIYTSGTTGKPKGVMIEHRSVVNLVSSDIDEFGLGPGDRVGQGSSAAYDSSVEEIWLAFASGATLVVMDDYTSRLGPDLVEWLRRERVTVFCPPPTLLRTTGCEDPETALPELRLLYVGGEALTDDLVERWARGRRLVNGYGPTECTVTVVRGDVTPGEPVTIGRPVPGHHALILDAELNEVADGESGELCLTGIGLARGYRNLDGVTREKFPVHPEHGRMYRTGDLVRREASGELSYLGRIDAQVKLRGYRVELEAIEACLVGCAGVREAACRVQGEGSEAVLAAHLVPADLSSPPVISEVKSRLRETLPPYMVPARFGLIETLPRSVGGKLDRKKLPPLGAGEGESRREVVEPSTPLERTILDAFSAALRLSTPVSTLDDFFLDLGGDSLSVVGVVCTLRREASTAAITTRDVYETRTAAALAARLATPSASQRSPKKLLRPGVDPREAGGARPMLTTVLQTLWILMELMVLSIVAYAAAFAALPWMIDRLGVLGTLAIQIPLSVTILVAYTIGTVALTWALKKLLIGSYQPVRTPVWSLFYLRNWVVQSAARLIPWNLLAGTTATGVVLRLLGAKVGSRVHIHRGVNVQDGGWDLLTIGDDVTLARDVHLGLVSLEDGCLCIGSVEIGDEATLDIRASVGAGSAIGAGGMLTALSWLADGERIPAGERWDGVPSVPSGTTPPARAIPGRTNTSAATYSCVHLGVEALVRAATPLPLLALLVAGMRVAGWSLESVAAWLSRPSWTLASLALTLVVSSAAVVCWLVLKALALRVAGRVRLGTIDRWSPAYLRVWHKAATVESAGMWLTGTLFWPIWLRLAGMRIGRDCEISTITDVVPETISIGGGSFFADGIYLGGPVIHRGTVTIGATSLGRGTFLGNHVVIPSGAQLPEDLFIGVCTVADDSKTRPGTSWFGLPPLELPKRDVVDVDPRLTHRPGFVRYVDRLFWESLRFTLPIFPILVGSLWLWGFSLVDAGPFTRALVIAPIVTLAALLVECLAVVALKWILLGRARSGQHPLWSCWCSRWDFLYVVWQFYALRPLAALEGTLYLSAYLRAMGAKVGKRVVLGPGMGQVADPDMIIIEDDATVCANYQAHSFEDRVLKLAPVIVRRGATVGESAVVFYGAEIGENAWVTPNSVVMKNERLDADSTYSGCPVREHPSASSPEPV